MLPHTLSPAAPGSTEHIRLKTQKKNVADNVLCTCSCVFSNEEANEMTMPGFTGQTSLLTFERFHLVGRPLSKWNGSRVMRTGSI